MNKTILTVFILSVSLWACNPKKAADKTATSKDSTAAVTPSTTTPSATDTSKTNLEPTAADSAKAEAALKVTSGTEKVGYLNSAELLEAMPETKAARKQLESFVNSNKAKYQSLQSTYEQKVKTLQENGHLLNEKEQQNRMAELQSLESEAGQMEQAVAKEEARLLEPIRVKANKIVEQVAKENGYTYILDPSMGGIVYADEARNILPLVKIKMGIGKKK